MTPPARAVDTPTSAPGTPQREPTCVYYELRIDGHLDEHWSTWFCDMTLAHEDDGTTTLRGPVTDQASLHGHLAKVRDIGATLVSVTSTDSADHASGKPG